MATAFAVVGLLAGLTALAIAGVLLARISRLTGIVEELRVRRPPSPIGARTAPPHEHTAEPSGARASKPHPHPHPASRAAAPPAVATESVAIVVHGRPVPLAGLRADAAAAGEYPIAVADVALHLSEIERVRGEEAPEEVRLDAVLLHEPTAGDPNGVAVYAAGCGQVGSLSHPMAQAWAPLLDEYRKAECVLLTRAVVRGAEEPGVFVGTDFKAATSALERLLASREPVPA